MKKTLLTLAASTALLSAGGDIAPATQVCKGLYTYSYMPHSGVEHACIDTGIANGVSADTLLRKKVRFHASLYFDGGVLTDASQQALNELKNVIADRGLNHYYVSVIGHTSGYEDAAHTVVLNGWSSFWQSLGGGRSMTQEEAATEVNGRIKAVYDHLHTKEGINTARLYTENRLARDPIATEAIDEGAALNERVDIALYY
jgi:hypothetical protein